MQMLQIFNEFAWLVQVGILDGVRGRPFNSWGEGGDFEKKLRAAQI